MEVKNEQKTQVEIYFPNRYIRADFVSSGIENLLKAQKEGHLFYFQSDGCTHCVNFVHVEFVKIDGIIEVKE